MKDQDKTKQQLIDELEELRQRIGKLEVAASEYERVEEALQESQERYRDIVELAPDGILTGNLKGVATSCNSAFLELTGFSRDEIVGTHISKFPTLRIEDIPEYAKMVFSAIQGKTTRPFEFIWIHKDGTKRWGEAHMGLMKKGSKVIGLQLILRDITERKRMEEELENQRRLWDALMENAPDLVYFKDNEHRMIRASQAYADVLGMDTEDLVAKIAVELWPKEGEEIMADERRVLAGESLVRKERKVTTPDGESLWYLLTKIPIYADGEIIGFFAIDKDITERKRVEETLRTSEETMRNILTASSVGLAHAVDRKIVWANEAMVKLFRFTHEEQYLGKDTALLYADREEYERIGRITYEQQQASQLIEFDAQFRRRDGSLFDGFVRVNLLDPGDPTKGIIVSIVDITERKRAEKALRKNEERLQLVLKGANLGLWDWNIQTGEIVFNDRWADMLGYTLDELEPHVRTWQELLHPDDLNDVMETLNAHLEGETDFYETEHRMRAKDGSWKWILDCGQLLEWDEQGKPLRAAGTHLDITERKQAEVNLKQSEEKFKKLAEYAEALIAIVSVENGTQYLYVNRAWEETLGYSQDELDAVSPMDIVHPEMRETVLERAQKRLEGKTVPKRYEMKTVTRSGDIRILDFSVVPIEYENRAALLTTAIDITERKRAEEALRESEAHYRSLFSNNHAVMLLIDPTTGAIEDANPAACAYYGYEHDVLTAMTIAEINILSFDQVYEEMQRAKQEERDHFFFHHRLASGEVRNVEVYSGPIQVSGQQLLYSIIHDITERKRAEEALRESEEKYRGLVEQSLQGVVIAQDNPVRLVFVSQPMEVITGFSLEELKGFNPQQLADLIHPQHRKIFFKNFRARLRGQDVAPRHEYRIIHRSGEDRWVEMYSSRIEYEGTPATQTVFLDITERKRAEEALRQSKHRLEKALIELRETQEQMMHQERMAAVGQLAAGIAHDFNNILAAITLYTQMSLKMSDLSPTIRKRLEVIAGQADRAADLIQQILDFGRRAVIERRPLTVDSFLKEVVKMLKRTLPEHVQIDLMIEPDEYIINADPTRVQQAIVNLALNARDAMPDGGTLHIALSRVEDKEINCLECGSSVIEGEWVQIEVSDDGTGIPPDVLPHIFEPFFTTRAPLGHGLGLAQVYGIVMQHDGHLEVETEIGVGTTFRLYWSALSVNKPDDQAPVQPDVCRGEGQVILVVEDDAIMRAALVDVLETLGYRTLEAADGREALAVCEEHKREISLVLSDWVMPSMGGAELARQLEARHIAVKVLMMTGHPLNEKAKSVMPDDVVGWVLKPPRLERLAEAISQGLNEEDESAACD